MDAGQRLIALTLALEEALENEDFGLFDALLASRQTLLESQTRISAPRIGQAQKIEERMIANARKRQIAIQAEIRKLLAKGRAEKAYATRQERSRIDLPAAG